MARVNYMKKSVLPAVLTAYQEREELKTCVENIDIVTMSVHDHKMLVDMRVYENAMYRGKVQAVRIEYKPECYAIPRYVGLAEALEWFKRAGKDREKILDAIEDAIAI